MTEHRTPLAVLLALAGVFPAWLDAQAPATQPATAPVERRTEFQYPCEGYLKGLRGRGNFGVKITTKGSVFSGSYHLAEDVWLAGGTEVRAVADGIVRYSDFSPTWTDKAGRVHWNLGNVIVVEHGLEPADGDLAAVCSVYVHLGANRKVAAGDRVTRGQPIGTIGADRSEENGRYPAHLHFGLHRGPYFQVSPAWRRQLEHEARTKGLALGPDTLLRGEIEVRSLGSTSVLVREKQGNASGVLSLLVGTTSPGHKPADIMGWCQGYGERDTIDEWLCPSTWIAARAAR